MHRHVFMFVYIKHYVTAYIFDYVKWEIKRVDLKVFLIEKKTTDN